MQGLAKQLEHTQLSSPRQELQIPALHGVLLNSFTAQKESPVSTGSLDQLLAETVPFFGEF